MKDYNKIPVDYMVDGVKRWIEHGVLPGGFLTAILENDLRAAVFKADGTNSRFLKEWVQWFQWEAPSQCWGSPEKVKAWIGLHVDALVEVIGNEQ